MISGSILGALFTATSFIVPAPKIQNMFFVDDDSLEVRRKSDKQAISPWQLFGPAEASATDGTVTHIGPYSVFITAPDGTQYRYLHMSNVEVKVGDKVNKGDHIGRISTVFTEPTTIHLHFEILQNVTGLGFVHVPPYMLLVLLRHQFKN
jgi:hypothetical protein